MIEAAAQEQEPCVSIIEAGKMLNASRRDIYSWVAQGIVPSVPHPSHGHRGCVVVPLRVVRLFLANEEIETGKQKQQARELEEMRVRLAAKHRMLVYKRSPYYDQTEWRRARATLDACLNICAKTYGTTVKDVLSATKTYYVFEARRAVAYMMMHSFHFTMADVCRALDRNHSSVYHAIEQVEVLENQYKAAVQAAKEQYALDPDSAPVMPENPPLLAQLQDMAMEVQLCLNGQPRLGLLKELTSTRPVQEVTALSVSEWLRTHLPFVPLRSLEDVICYVCRDVLGLYRRATDSMASARGLRYLTEQPYVRERVGAVLTYYGCGWRIECIMLQAKRLGWRVVTTPASQGA